MNKMPRYGYYREAYGGSKIPEEEFPALIHRAQAVLQNLERRYTLTGSQDARFLALCALAEALWEDEAVTAQTLGSVTVRYRRSANALYRAAARYLDIYRGVGP